MNLGVAESECTSLTILLVVVLLPTTNPNYNMQSGCSGVMVGITGLASRGIAEKVIFFFLLPLPGNKLLTLEVQEVFFPEFRFKYTLFYVFQNVSELLIKEK